MSTFRGWFIKSKWYPSSSVCLRAFRIHLWQQLFSVHHFRYDENVWHCKIRQILYRASNEWISSLISENLLVTSNAILAPQLSSYKFQNRQHYLYYFICFSHCCIIFRTSVILFHITCTTFRISGIAYRIYCFFQIILQFFRLSCTMFRMF